MFKGQEGIHREMHSALKKLKIFLLYQNDSVPTAYLLSITVMANLQKKKSPQMLGADIIIGSLIKNAGGGIAPNGGYILGKKAAY